jgi:hypothetical protein
MWPAKALVDGSQSGNRWSDASTESLQSLECPPALPVCQLLSTRSKGILIRVLRSAHRRDDVARCSRPDAIQASPLATGESRSDSLTHTGLLHAGRGGRLIVVTGILSAGKTTASREIARRSSFRYFDGDGQVRRALARIRGLLVSPQVPDGEKIRVANRMFDELLVAIRHHDLGIVRLDD